MLSSMLARCARAGLALMVVTVWAMSAPLPSAEAAAREPSSARSAVLAQGVGMGHRPSVRVRRLQRILERAGFDVGSPGADGRFGALTAAAVRRMQNGYGLVSDGIVGPKTGRVVALIADRQLLRQRARDRSGTAGPRAPQGSAKPQTAPPGTSPAKPQTAPPGTSPAKPQTAPPGTSPAQPTPGRPTATTDATGAQRADTIVPIVLAATAVLLAAVALAVTFARARRPHDAATVVGVPRDLYLEGHSGDERVGAFRGFALATALPSPGRGDGAEERYLVDDPRKPAPVWVRRSEIRRSPSKLPAGEPVLGYVTAGDPRREHEQFAAIEEACQQAGWELEEIIRDDDRPRMSTRPGLRRALDEIAGGRARGLVIGDVRRAAHSVAALGVLIEWFRDADATLVALDLDLDTSTVSGRQTAAALIGLAEWEGDRARSRRRSGLASVKDGEHPGHRAQPTAHERASMVQRIKAMRQAGMSLQAIADQLNKEDEPTLRGGAQWRPRAVQSALSDGPTRTDRDERPPVARQEGDQ